MGENFKRLKNKYLVAAIIKSAITGVSCGLGAVDIILLSLKLSAIYIHWGYYVLIGVGVALLVGGGLFLALRPTDAKLAKKLDAEYNLGEKTQTMVAFAEQTGDMIELQRQDTEELLKNLAPAKVKYGSIWQQIAAVALSMWQQIAASTVAVAMTVAAIVVPAVTLDPGSGGIGGGPVIEQPTDEKDKLWEYDLFLQAAMADLVLNIRESSLTDSEKAAYLAVLEELDSSLKPITVKSQMKAVVIAAVRLLDGITDTVSTYRKFSAEMSKFEEVLSPAVVDAATCYKEFKSQITTMRYVQALELDLASWAEQRLADPLTNSANSIKLRNNSDTGEALGQFIEGLTETLANIDVGEDDALYKGVVVFLAELRDVMSKVNKGYGATKNNTSIDAAYNSFKNALLPALKIQSYNGIMNIFTRQKLASIFDISLSDMPPLPDDLKTETGSSGNDENPDDEPGGNGGNGGYGDGGENYGSNDLVFDPETGEKVPYGQVLDKYYAKYVSYISSGEYEYIAKYFNSLFGGIEGFDPDQQ